MNTLPIAVRRLLLAVTALSMIFATSYVAAIGAHADVSDVQAATTSDAPSTTGPGPVEQRPSSMVTADALPTVQINGGVVWSQIVVGNTVYAAGSFSNTRPAGAAAGTNLTPRANLLAYDITTGNLITSFNPSLNAQARVVVKSPDGSRIYVGGDFTQANGETRYLVAAYSTATGQLISSFAPSIGGSYVTSIAATNSVVYVGGLFTQAGGLARQNLAAFSAATGAVLGWAPTAQGQVDAMVMTPDNSKVIVGGRFTQVNGVADRGLAALSASDGTLEPWAANQVIYNAGNLAGIYSLSTDGNAVFGTGWGFGSVNDGNLEGAFSADPDTGAINWVENCHGDTYGAYSDGTSVYTVSHAHYCGTVGGFPQSNPWSTNMRHAIAFTAKATGVSSPDPYAGGTYYNWAGTPAPSMYNWFPDMAIGSYTGQSQAAWTVTGNGRYVVMGGEFPTVNFGTQQGLVRFAVPSQAPKKQGPRLQGSNWIPGVVSLAPGTARISFSANTDRDDKTLTYNVIRDGKTGSPIYTTTADSEYWDLPALGYVDTGLTPGSTHTYRVTATDSDGNIGYSQTVSVTISSTPPSAYVQQVLDDGAGLYWRMNQPSGATTESDWAGFNDGTVGSGVTSGTAGAILGDPDTASTFSGSSGGLVATQTPIAGPNTFTISAWFKTTSRSGGKIVGFGNANTGTSSSYDRHVYMDSNGRVLFGVYPGSMQTLSTTTSYNDGQWHQVVASLSSAGMALYLDGQRVASRTDVTYGQDYSGYWRVGGDTSWSGNAYFAGSIDDVAIFPTALTRQQVHGQYVAAGYSSGAAAPTDPYGAAVYSADPDLYWRLDDASGSRTAADGGPYLNPGTVSNTGVSFGVPGISVNGTGLSGITDTAATFNGSSGTIASTRTAANPTVYTEQAWFTTTTTSGGKILGLGSSATGSSSSNDRNVYMLNDGRLSFGVNGASGVQVITTTQSYNDGKWHQVVATQGPGGMTLYVDGTERASNTVTTAQNFTGYWRVGGDNLSGWPNRPSSDYFAGTIDEVAIYSTELAGATVAAHYQAATGVTPDEPPVAAFTATAAGSDYSFDASGSADPDGTIDSYAWDFGDGAHDAGKTASHSYAAPGAYLVTLSVTDNDGVTATKTQRVVVGDAYSTQVNGNTPYLLWRLSDATGSTAVDSGPAGNNGTIQGGVTLGTTGPLAGTGAATFNGNNGVVVSPTAMPGPTVYSEEAWFSTTTTAGGKIIGFGNAASGNSSNYDRHIYLDGAGHLNFGVYTGTENVITSPGTYNDGAWHQVVATQGPSGMKLYVDGQLVASGSQSQAQAYNGYFRVGGDSSWDGTAPYFSGVIANAAVYLSELPASQVLADFAVGSGTAPAAQFTDSTADLVANFDGTTSTAASGRSIVSYAWDFGDQTSGTGATTTHTYTAGGSYQVKLTVTDDHGLTDTVSHTVTVHSAPTAAFTATPSSLTAAVDGSASKAYDGAAITTYDWSWGDGTADTVGTDATVAHAYATAGTYQVTLTVTDDQGATSTVEHDVVVAHADPVAAFTPTMAQSDLTVDAAASKASDGATLSYDWNWGDGSAHGSGVTATHHYAAVGSYTVTLTVTDSLNGTATITHDVTASAHVAPSAVFSSSVGGLTVAFDGSGSSAADGASISSYAWDFGDSSAAGSGAKPSHTYAAAGSYSVKLTVTDSLGATSSVTHSVTVSAPPASDEVATDAFGRTASNGWGSADTGGAWSLSGSSSSFAVSGGVGTVRIAGAGSGPSAWLNSVSAGDVDAAVDVSLDKVPSGNGAYITLAVRHSSSGEYRAKVQYQSSGAVKLFLTKVDGGTETTLKSATVSGLTAAAGDVLRIEVSATGSGTTTLQARVWKASGTAPAWQVTATDTTSALQDPGSVGVMTYLTGSATNAPLTISFDNLNATKAD